MKITTIYYFSGTGNSLMITKDLAAKIGDCDLVPIAQVWQQERPVAKTDRIGFVFPLYYVGLPRLVHDFITKLEVSQNAYVFMVVTRGVPLMGGAIRQVKGFLRRKATALHAGFYVNMPSNYILWGGAPSETKQQKLFRQARDKVADIAAIIRRKETQFDIEPFGFLRPLRNTPYLKQAHERDNHFVIEEQCTACGICTKVCPVNNITLAAGKPQWHHACQECLTCLQFCPQKAIQYGTKTTNKTRYHHPDITVRDIIAQRRTG